MRLTKLKCKTKKALAASACINYDQKPKGNKANTCIGNFLQFDYVEILAWLIFSSSKRKKIALSTCRTNLIHQHCAKMLSPQQKINYN